MVRYIVRVDTVDPSIEASLDRSLEREGDSLDDLGVARVVPAHPDAPGVPFPRIAEDAYDAELETLSFRRAFRRTDAREHFVLFLRLLTIVAASVLAFALRHDLHYAFASREPTHLDALSASADDLAAAAHHHVVLRGVPGGVGAVDYRRSLQDGLYRLAPLVERPEIYVELRLPKGSDPARFIPPTSVSGRFVPLDEGGARFSSARALIESTVGRPAPKTAYLLEEGVSPTVRSPGSIIAALAIAIGLLQLSMLRTRRPDHRKA
ncbi:MAG: hypothetical protein NVS3B20_07380 [Polyangiales bacterium]